MNVSPLFENVLCKRKAEEKMTAGGLYVPQTAQETSQEAVVLAIGSGRILDSGNVVKMTVKPGDKVLLPLRAGTEFKMDGQDLVMIPEYQIMAVLQDQAAQV